MKNTTGGISTINGVDRMKIELNQHEGKFIHVPKNWLRWSVMLPALLLAGAVIFLAHNLTFSITLFGQTVATHTGNTISSFGWLIAANILVLTFAWCRKRLAFALAFALVCALGVALVCALVCALGVAIVGDEEHDWWYFDD